jgi:predicted ATPase/DNA-binding SARP family transcriptional activator
MLSQSAELRVQLLGSFRVWVGNDLIAIDQWHLRKAKSIIKLLALAPDHYLHRDQLIELLWPRLDPKGAANNFYQTLYAVRRVIKDAGAEPQPYLQLHEEILRLCPEVPLWVDVEAFESAARLARRSQNPTDYHAALELYSGELLPEDRYEDWAASRRHDLYQEYLRLLFSLAYQYQAEKRYPQAIEILQQVLAHEHADGEAHTGLMRLYALSEQRQKALLQYRHLDEILSRELGVGPDRQATRLYQDILAGRFPPSEAIPPQRDRLIIHEEAPQGSPRPAHNLPTLLTSFVGRDHEKAEIYQILAPVAGTRRRLLTLTGPGGCGKTRLALEAACELLDAYPQGIWQVELAGLADPSLLPQVIAATLELQETAGKALLDTLIAALRSGQVLIVLDNCEHLIEACARLSGKLLRSCPQLRILATSREALGVVGETVFRVSPLALPDLHHIPPFEFLIQTESMQLFLERARVASPGFNLNPENVMAVAQICHRLDGIPLAIELAAAQVKALHVRQIAVRLEQRFDLLDGSLRPALPHHQTLAASFDWSYDLLPPDERRLFRRLSVFTGGWWLEAAEAVASSEAEAPIEGGLSPARGTVSYPPGTVPDWQRRSKATEHILTSLIQLANKSMVVAVQDTAGETRYHMLETIRQYGLDKLKASGEEREVRNRHLGYYLQQAEQAELTLRGPDHVAWLNRLETELDNLRAALDWALECASPAIITPEGSPSPVTEGAIDTALRLATALGQFWHLRSLPSEGVRWLERVLAAETQERASQPLLPERALLRARALFTAGWLASYIEEMEHVAAFSEESLVLLRQLGPQGRHNAAYVLINLAELARKQGDHVRERDLIEESLAIFREMGDRFGIADLLNNFLGVMTMMTGDYGQAQSLQQEALALRQEIGDRDGLALSLTQLGWVALSRGDYPQAADLCQASLADFEGLGNRYGACRALYLLGQVAWAMGEYGRADEHFTKALAVGREMDHKHGMCYALLGLGQVAYSRGDMSAAGAYYKEALELLGEIRDRWLIALLVCAVAYLAAARDQVELAVRLCAAAQEMYDLIHFVLTPAERAMHDSNEVGLRSALGEAAYQDAWRAGLALGLDKAVQQARRYVTGCNPESPG